MAVSRAKPKLVDFPGPMDRGGRRNVALLAHRVKNDQVRNVLCVYEMVDGQRRWFRNNLSPAAAVVECHRLQNACLRDALSE